MASFTTEGIILKRSNYGEADRRLTIITPFRGKVVVVAKGVRRITSRRGGNVELLNKVRLQLYEGPGNLTLTEAESLQTYPKIKSDLVLLSYASHISEIVDKIIPENQVNPTAYQLLASVLELLEKHPRQIFVRAFEVKLLSEMGFWSVDKIEATLEIKKLLQELQYGSWKKISELQITPDQSLELERILRYYMEKVLERSLKSLNIIKKLKEMK